MGIDKYTWETDDLTVAPCATCKHKRQGATCTAFPNGIPIDILDGRNQHQRPYPGDHGIQFEPVTKARPGVK